MKILITGANGFIGKALCNFFVSEGFNVRAAVRLEKKLNQLSAGIEKVCVGDVGPQTDWSAALEGIDVVVHLAARVHIMRDEAKDPLSEYRRVNVEGTRQLARMAMAAGVKRFVFLSTIKVNGEETGIDRPFTEKDAPNPQDDYALSKWEAEKVLQDTPSQGGLEVVILRVPLVYGPGVKANFRKLINISGLPLPLKGIVNSRSFIFLDNLTDVIKVSITHPLAAGETFLVSDGQDVSTPDLIRKIAAAKKRTAKLFFLPPTFLKILAKAAGREKAFRRLTGSLVVDSGKIRNVLGWKPPFNFEEGMKKTVEDYK